MSNQIANHATPIYADNSSENDSFVWRIRNEDGLDSWLEQYLNGERLQQRFYEQENEVSLVLSTIQASELSLPLIDQQFQHGIAPNGKNKSIFHNFQKNLLSLLKRTIHIKRQDLLPLPYGVGAFDLWSWFLHEQIQSKKALYVTFGVKPKENGKLLKKISLRNPNIQKMLGKYGLDSIEQSQKLLRTSVHDKALLLQKIDIEKICKVKDFPRFYRYFLIFVDEILQGALSQRMTKVQKYRNMNSLQ